MLESIKTLILRSGVLGVVVVRPTCILWTRFIVMAVMISGVSGCATTMRYAFDDNPSPCKDISYSYGGTLMDSIMLAHSLVDDDGDWRLGALVFLDLPLSLAFDTVLLPVSIPLDWDAYQQCQAKQSDA